MATGPPRKAVRASTSPVGLECREPGQTWLLVGWQGQGQEGRRLGPVPWDSGATERGAGKLGCLLPSHPHPHYIWPKHSLPG